MNIQLGKLTIPLWKQIDVVTLLRKGIWLFVVIMAILYSIAGTRDDLATVTNLTDRWTYVYLNVPSFVLGVLAAAIIFWRKPSSLMAFAISLMLITFTATDTGFRFWRPLFTDLFSGWNQNPAVPLAAALFLDVLFMAIFTSSLTYVLLTFPDDRLPSRKVRWFFNLLIVAQVLLIFFIGLICLVDIFVRLEGDLANVVYLLLDLVKSFLLIGLAAWQILRLRRITDPIKRQQIKWIAASLVGMTFFYSVGKMYAVLYGVYVPAWAFLPNLFFTYGFIITLFIAIVRYRFWDMSFFINKALVYSSVTAILGVVGLGGAALAEFFAKEFMTANSSLVGLVLLLLVVALIAPVRDRMQAVVDRHLKPEEIDFTGAIVELAPDSQLMLSSQDILRILIRQTVEPLDISGASIHLRRPDGQLVPAEPAAFDPEAPQFRLDDKTRSQLEKGEVVVPPEGSPFSLYIPLVITRAARPDFLGVLVLGPRNTGEGYSTPVLKSLRKLGCDAGKAIYIAQLREHLGHNIMERLAAIERSLSGLHEPREA
jgi:hypothetical protein